MKHRRMLALLTVIPFLSACHSPAPAKTLKTPQYQPSAALAVDFEAIPREEIHTASEGIVKIEPPKRESAPAPGGQEDAGLPDDAEQASESAELPILIGQTPDTLWENDEVVTYSSFTLPEKAALNQEGCVGILSIPSIDLRVNVYEAENEMEAMLHGGAHYKETSCYDGNVGISAHVSGVPDAVSFAKLHQLQKGDRIQYETAIGIRTYQVTEKREIPADDWSWLSRTPDNRITLTTCIEGQPDKRLMVQGIEG